MERYNPFSNTSLNDDTDPFNRSTESPNSAAVDKNTTASNQSPRRYQSSTTISGRFAASNSGGGMSASQASPPSSSATNLGGNLRYSTAFPDPFGDTEPDGSAGVALNNATTTSTAPIASSANTNNRSNSVTFAPASSRSVDDPVSIASASRSSRREAGGITSFLSRATSVTSSTVTDRVSEAVGSMRNAVDTISNQIQQAVPTNLNERFSSTATSLMSTTNDQTTTQQQQQQDKQQQQQNQQQQSAASYLASKLSSATNQFTSSSPSSGTLPLISRQRVILILDTPGEIDWQQQFIDYRRLASGLGPASSNALTSFFSSATAQLTSSSNSNQLDGVDLIEQADFRDVSVLANQSTSTATVLVTSNTSFGSATQSRLPAANKASTKIIRPEYVVIRQRTKNGLEHMRGIVTALNYCLVPMFEPVEIWNTFQDRRLIFAKLLRIQKQLGREKFPLIPQVYCQTHQDFLNYVNSSTVVLPCLVRTGQSGEGKIKMDNIQMLKDFASIVATSNLSCTVEPYLDVKCDLIVQKLGSNLKLFRKNTVQGAELGLSDVNTLDSRQSASRQTSLGTGVLSSLISTTTNQAQQISRQSSHNPYSTISYEKLSEVNKRYKNWIEAVAREFDDKLEVCSMKIVVTNQDREYIVGLGNCSMDFLGNTESRDEDKNDFVELIINNMNSILPQSSSKEVTNNLVSQQTSARLAGFDRRSSDDRATLATTSLNYQSTTNQDSPLGDKKKFTSQTQINGHAGVASKQFGHPGISQMGNRSQSVSMNQSEYMLEKEAINKSTGGSVRRGSERSDSFTNETSVNGSRSLVDGASDSTSPSLHQRQASLGQSFFDQTSTAFNTLQKQSMSFFKRLDSRAGELGSNTPPQSAKSDRGFERSSNSNDDLSEARGKNGFKSQSIDSWVSVNKPPERKTPPKPPPPQCLGNRQSSLASYSTQSPRQNKSTTPASTRQNSTIGTESTVSSSPDGAQRARVIRQNSALSAFEPYDPNLTLHLRNESAATAANTAATSTDSSTTQPMSKTQSQQNSAGDSSRVNKQLEPVKRSSNFDSASITSGDSNSTSETTTAEDTMNNLKKTFASIFGDKCE